MASNTRSKRAAGNHYRIAIMGPAAVGKTALVNQFLYRHFQQAYKKTVEDMHHGEFNLDGTKLTLELLDTAGAYEFPEMRRLAITTSQAFVLVYAQDDPDSFRQVSELRDVILSQRETEDVPIVVVANKADCVAKKALETESAIVSVDWNNGFVSASAKKGTNVVAIFSQILRLLSKEDAHLGEALMRRWSMMQNKDGNKENKGRWSFKLRRRNLFSKS